MAYQSLGIGGSANDGTGDTLRAASDKINDNFLEIYTLIGDASSLSTGISATASVITLTAPSIATSIAPSAADGATLGTASLEFSDLYLADGGIIYLGDDQDINITHVADTGITTNGTFQATTITATTAVVPDASDGAALGTTALEWSDLYLADGGIIYFGDDQEITLTHVHDDGLILKHVGTGDGKEPSLSFHAGDNDIAINDVLGSIFFKAPDEGAGTDAILVAAGVEAVSEGDFSSSNNATKLSFLTAASEAASEKMSLSSAGLLTIADDLMIKDGGTIGVASTNDAITISSAGIVTLKDDLVIKDGGTIGVTSAATAMTISAAGIVTFVDDIVIKDGGTIGTSTTPAALTVASGGGVTFSAAPVFPNGSIDLADLDIDGGTDIGEAIVDADLFVIDNGAGGTNRKTTAARVKTYIGAIGMGSAIAAAIVFG